MAGKSFERFVKATLIALPLLWAVAWYLAWFDHDDCLDALQRVGGGVDDGLYRSLISECIQKAQRLHLVVNWVLGALVLAEVVVWWRFVRRK